MADVYELQLALDPPGSPPRSDLALLRRHLGDTAEGGRDGHGYPLLADRGPARRIGGALLGELRGNDARWSLTARQKTHPDELDGLRRSVRRLGERTTVGTTGHLRFYGTDVPEVLVAAGGGTVDRRILSVDRTVDMAAEAIPDPRG